VFFMTNQSKVGNPRFQRKWRESGAIGNMEDARNTAVYGGETAMKLRRYDCRNQDLSGIDKALGEGFILRAFRSGGGLRVVRIEGESEDRDGELKGYGEHPNLMPAIRRASQDFLAGGEPYDTVYLTGTTQADDSLDAWVLNGHKLLAEGAEGGVRVEARNYNYKPIVSVVGETFGEAYASLCGQVTEDAFEQANGF